MKRLVFEHGAHESIGEAVRPAFPLQMVSCGSAFSIPLNRKANSVDVGTSDWSQVEKSILVKGIKLCVGVAEVGRHRH